MRKTVFLRRLNSYSRDLLTGVALAALVCSGQSRASDQAYPSRPVTLVVAQAPGGGPDMLARLVAKELNTLWKQAVIVENRPGAAGAIAAAHVAKAPADGHTLFLTSAGIMTIAPAVPGAKLAYGPDDFAPLLHMGSMSNVFVVDARSQIKSIQALVETAKRKPDGLSSGSLGVGSTGQISSEVLARLSGMKLVHVPYKSESLGVTDLRGGHLDVMPLAMPVALPHVKSGALIPLAVTGARRSSLLPNVPTVRESGFGDYEVAQWYGLFAPAATPKAIQFGLIAAVRGVMDKASVQKEILDMGMDLTVEEQRDFAAFNAVERRRWTVFFQARGQAAK